MGVSSLSGHNLCNSNNGSISNGFASFLDLLGLSDWGWRGDGDGNG